MNNRTVKVSIRAQKLWLKEQGKTLACYPVATATKGAGERMDSNQTPCGLHAIAEKIGDHAAINTVFVGRCPTGEVFNAALEKKRPEHDWILTRILWLRGLEPDINQGGNTDTYRRYIYIHGSPDDQITNGSGSKGCIRMRNRDMIDLFNAVDVDTLVQISNADIVLGN